MAVVLRTCLKGVAVGVCNCCRLVLLDGEALTWHVFESLLGAEGVCDVFGNAMHSRTR